MVRDTLPHFVVLMYKELAFVSSSVCLACGGAKFDPTSISVCGDPNTALGISDDIDDLHPV